MPMQSPCEHLRGNGGLVNIEQHLCISAGILAAQSDWLMWQLSHLYWASLPLSFTYHILQIEQQQQLAHSVRMFFSLEGVCLMCTS